MIEVDIKQETPIRVGADSPELTLEQVKTIISIVKWGDNPPKELRLNNVVFNTADSDILIELAYSVIQWTNTEERR